jgi:hypothetical protein
MTVIAIGAEKTLLPKDAKDGPSAPLKRMAENTRRTPEKKITQFIAIAISIFGRMSLVWWILKATRGSVRIAIDTEKKRGTTSSSASSSFTEERIQSGNQYLNKPKDYTSTTLPAWSFWTT